MKATLNLNKTDLIAKLESRKDEIKAKYAEDRKEIQDVIDSRATAVDNTTLHAEYYEQLAAALRDGTVSVTPGTGKLKGAPARPGTKGYKGAAVATTPRRPGRHRNDWEWYATDQLEAQIEHVNGQEQHFLKPLDTAIDLLNLSTDTVVEIDTSDYQALLDGSARGRW